MMPATGLPNRSLLAFVLIYAHVVLSILGLASLVVACFLAGAIVGFVGLGVALLVLAFYLESEK